MEMFKYKIKRKEIFIDIRYRVGIVEVQEGKLDKAQVLNYISVRDAESILGKKEVNYVQSNLKIIAPKDHYSIQMIKSGSRLIPLFKIDEETRNIIINTEALEEEIKNNQKVLDPILALEVEGGYIILHAWDEEAYIPEIQNPNFN